jgi:hypothetical protein
MSLSQPRSRSTIGSRRSRDAGRGDGGLTTAERQELSCLRCGVIATLVTQQGPHCAGENDRGIAGNFSGMAAVLPGLHEARISGAKVRHIPCWHLRRDTTSPPTRQPRGTNMIEKPIPLREPEASPAALAVASWRLTGEAEGPSISDA